ncbi:2124_t:CDS:2, partial [Funneliformis caledonium]
FRIEFIQAMPGSAMIYFTNATIPLNASNIVLSNPQFTIIDSQENNLNTVVLNRITCFIVFETREYTISLGRQVVFMLKTQIQQCTIVGLASTTLRFHNRQIR